MSGTGGFQTQVQSASAPGVAGDFCSNNVWFSVDAGPGGLVAGSPNGVNIGLFAWTFPPVDANGTNQVVQNYGSGPVAGFVHRAQQGLITTYLSNAGVNIPQGFQMGLMSGGDFWVKNDGSTEALPGQKCYANFADGKASFAATASAATIATSTASTITAQTLSVTGSISGDVLTVTAVGSGTVVPGAILSGTAGGGVASGTKVISQITPLLSGEATGGIGRYLVSITEQTIPSGTITGTYGLLTIGGSLTGTYGVGDVVTGTGVTTGTVITALGTGTGGAGTYVVSPSQAMSSSAVNSTGNVETKWIAMSSGLAGELVKISSQPLG